MKHDLKKLDMQQSTIYILSQRAYRKKHHVSYDTVLGMENACINKHLCGGELVQLSPCISLLNTVLKKLRLHDVPDCFVPKNKQRNYLFIAMGIDDLKGQKETLRYLSNCGNTVILYCFDVWESMYSEWSDILNYIHPTFMFMAYERSANYFSKQFDNVFFLPQSMDADFFYPREGSARTRLFMQMGRKNNRIHEMILKYLADHGLDDIDDNYIYERIPGKIIYPDTNELAENICRSKYFICAPQSSQNSSLTGKVSDVTARFYEAMACKTLIVGFKPDTFDTLFPSDAMVEVLPDGSDFEEKISYYESHPDEYNNLVERNYNLVMNRHMWSNRFADISDKLTENV